jgi:RNA polymerase sigma factor (sigma-70 family)
MDADTPDPLLDLVYRWQAGDAEAGNQILVEIEPWLRREVSRAMSGKPVNAQDSADLTQQAITNFLESGPRFVPRSGAEFRSLLRRIALNELVDQSRKGKHRDGLKADTLFGASRSHSGFEGVVPTVERPSHLAAAGEEWNWLRLALQYLEADDRRLLIASEVDGLSWGDIADELGLASADAARVKAARLKPRLANLIRKLKAGRTPEGDLAGG